MIYLCNSFSLQMLDLEKINFIEVTPLKEDIVKELLRNGFTSAIGHQDTANILTSILGFYVPMNRINISLTLKDTLIVAQITGGRLPEGTTTLPNGYQLKFVKVELIYKLKGDI